MQSRVIEWDGTHLPDELRELAPGRYFVGPVDDVLTLTSHEEAKILAGLDQLDAQQSVTHEKVSRDVQSGFKRE